MEPRSITDTIVPPARIRAGYATFEGLGEIIVMTSSIAMMTAITKLIRPDT